MPRPVFLFSGSTTSTKGVPRATGVRCENASGAPHGVGPGTLSRIKMLLIAGGLPAFLVIASSKMFKVALQMSPTSVVHFLNGD